MLSLPTSSNLRERSCWLLTPGPAFQFLELHPFYLMLLVLYLYLYLKDHSFTLYPLLAYGQDSGFLYFSGLHCVSTQGGEGNCKVASYGLPSLVISPSASRTLARPDISQPGQRLQQLSFLHVSMYIRSLISVLLFHFTLVPISRFCLSLPFDPVLSSAIHLYADYFSLLLCVSWSLISF